MKYSVGTTEAGTVSCSMMDSIFYSHCAFAYALTFKPQHPDISTVISKCQINLRTIALNIQEFSHPLKTELELMLILVLLNHLILFKRRGEPKYKKYLEASGTIFHTGLLFLGLSSMKGDPLGYTSIR